MTLDTSTSELFQRLAVALAIGLLIGIERGWSAREEPEGERSGGLRTFALMGLLGGVWGVLAGPQGGAGLIAASLAFAVLSATFAAYRWRENLHEQRFGATTMVAAMVTFALGLLAAVGDMVVAAAAGVAVAGLLALKSALHGWVRRLSWPELRSGLMLLAMTVILLPLLPDRSMGPYDALNPRQLWLMTVLIAAMSFAGYVAIRVAGERMGLVLSGVAGGLVSSTVVTLTMGRLARARPGAASVCAGGAGLASAAMVARVLVVTGVISQGLSLKLLPVLAPAGLAVAAASLMAIGGGRKTHEPQALVLDNPFELGTVLRFGALLVVIMLVTKAMTALAGERSLLLLGAVSGIADVDAISLSMARMAGSETSYSAAALVVLTAVGVNTLVKAGLAATTGGPAMGWRFGAVTAAGMAAALVGLMGAGF